MEAASLAVAVGARLVVGLLLLAAGAAKLRGERTRFREAILSFGVGPRWAARPIAQALPWIECALGAAVLVGAGTQPAALAAFAVIAAMTLVVVVALGRGQRVFCPCFGFTGAQVAKVQWAIAYRNLVLLLACMAAFGLPDPWRVERVWGVTSLADPRAGLQVALAAFLALLAFVAIVRAGRRDDPLKQQQPGGV